MDTPYHIPALLNETLAGLAVRSDGTYVDLTFGGGGHSRAILQQLGEGGRLYSFDQDLDAYHHAGEEFRGNSHWQFVHSNFRYLSNFMDYYGVTAVDGILADLGVSFHHFDDPERGFSFRFDAPLDMRMNRRAGRTAADVVNSYSEARLADVLYLYGELRNARVLARRIVQARSSAPILRTTQLAELLGNDKHTQTVAFQALRIEVNDELGALREMLTSSLRLLRPGGRIAILTYHSLEDRIVKNFLRAGNIEGVIEKDFYGNILTPFRLLEKGLTASAEEVAANPRSRSAKLRVAQKI
ncbi:MAG: 16S rRNA (cytosine(1402)-N(4))-methyltransferase RsmH [Paludibacteraceae bacterium]|nr:16S rRNA (cytosine(1402)-N(4))-methyltransferase RsmH [Paludibacteraceae bacterium]